MALKEITADEADALWELRVPIWYKTSCYDWRRQDFGAVPQPPFWARWVVAAAPIDPKLAAEVE